MRISELLDWLESSIPVWEEAALPDVPIDPASVDLQKEYGKLNAQLFDGKLGMYPMKWNRRKGAGALVRFQKARSWDGSFKLVIKGVEVSTYYQSTMIGFYSRLAHEMIHVFLIEQNIDNGHGHLFLAQMRRINAMKPGFEIKVSENATDFIPTVVAKTGKGKRFGVLIFNNRSIRVFTPNHFTDTLSELIGGFTQAWLEGQEFEWWFSDDPTLMHYPAARSIGRKFTAYTAKPEELAKIREGEKIAEMKGGQPKILMPKYFGGASGELPHISVMIGRAMSVPTR